MGRMDIRMLRYLSPTDFRLLTAVEMGMKNHELVPTALVVAIARVHGVGVHKRLRDLAQYRLVAYERGASYDGYRLTNLGYDFLALKVLASREIVDDIYLATGRATVDAEPNDVVIKFHRLGRTSFRRIKEKRDYHQNRAKCSWLYLSRLAAVKEYAFMRALHARDFAVPRPIDCCRHCIVMERVEGITLAQVVSAEEGESVVHNVPALYDTLMNMIVRLAEHGLIHGDFNEFNLMFDPIRQRPVMIDFPQMVSTSHANASTYFERDVNCVRDFFRRRFHYESEMAPNFAEIEKESNLDEEVSASGYTVQLRREWQQAVDDEQIEQDSDDDKQDQSIPSNNDIDTNEQKTTADDTKHRKSADRIPLDHLAVWLSKHGPEQPESHEDTASSDSDDDDMATASVAATIAPDVIRARVRQQCDKKQRVKLKVKGKANAVQRKRKDNTAIMKEYEGWDDFN